MTDTPKTIERLRIVSELCSRSQGASRTEIAKGIGWKSAEGMNVLLHSFAGRLKLHRRQGVHEGGTLVRWFSNELDADVWYALHATTGRKAKKPEPPAPVDVPIAGGAFAVAGPRVPLTGVRPNPVPLPPRPGSEDHQHFPSRMGNHLYYRDGRVEKAI